MSLSPEGGVGMTGRRWADTGPVLLTDGQERGASQVEKATCIAQPLSCSGPGAVVQPAAQVEGVSRRTARYLKVGELAELAASVPLLILGETHSDNGCAALERFLMKALAPGWVLVFEGLRRGLETSTWLGTPDDCGSIARAFRLARGTGVRRLVGCEPALAPWSASMLARDSSFAEVLIELQERGERAVLVTGRAHAEPTSRLQHLLGRRERVTVLMMPDRLHQPWFRVNYLQPGYAEVGGRIAEAPELGIVTHELDPK